MKVVVIGAGLSGLSAADLLTRSGIRVRVLEARDRPGGRTLSLPLQARSREHLDLGATWAWPHQGHLRRLASELHVDVFEQYVDGNLTFDQEPSASLHAYPSPMTGTFRFAGGAMALARRLMERLPQGSVAFDTVATTVDASRTAVQVGGIQAGRPVAFSADAVVVAVPPRLTEHTIRFTPALDIPLAHLMRGTPTWMGFAMKVGVIYHEPFWRANGLSGFGVSHLGPLQEIHDASPSQPGMGALFGFVGSRALMETTSTEDHRAMVLRQLVRMFGREAAHPVGYFELDWSRERYTSAPLDRQTPTVHPTYGDPLFEEPALFGRVYWAGAETTAVEGGLLEGAVRAGVRAAQDILTRLR
ncbi:flavin monoamine oxidase family protein [Deinococcus peraridilitoris]|uniref:Monoamine oxidase n=1 Tax=Deinococcus peraridilitoris (strain DSM 19664 / LMG 22246 / CIP 109416 / KR-200) TaxID=937777 RepID=L0A051_DEIPD|nr:FAD-dependent oxidoreductase [Deinococcus peraridilitoris]AFZ67211.1 monoamine oxidase [Deinococcus peraridilitoris DSM 19664]